MSDDSDSDFGFGSSSPFLDDDEPSTTTQESVVVGAHGRQQQQQQQDVDTVSVIEENKDNGKPKENNDIPSLNGEQDNEGSSTTQEAVMDDGRR